MRIARGGRVFVGAAVLVWAAAFLSWSDAPGSGRLVLLEAAFLLAAGMFWFFRDPERLPREAQPPGTVLAPCDGRIVDVRADDEHTLLAVYLNLLDLHVVRTPVSLRVEQVTHRAGSHRRASSDDTGGNERVTFTGSGAHGGIRLDAIAGLVARRIVPYVVSGDELAAGDRMCLIRFGSRVEITLPVSCDLLCGVGDRIRGGETPVARIQARTDGR